MDGQRWFYRDEEDWLAFAERLKLTACPYCLVIGALIRHGVLYGFDDRRPQRLRVRAHRVFCSNRHARPGCGRTVSVWAADRIRRLVVSTGSLWRFLQRAVAAGLGAALRACASPLSDRTWWRLWRRFRCGQSTLRTALHGCCPPPDLPEGHTAEAQVLAHCQAAFADAPCPFAAFQLMLRTFCL